MGRKKETVKIQPSQSSTQTATLPTPAAIKNFLDQYVIGQEDAKRILSVAVYNHYKKVLYNAANEDFELDKSNIILLGDTGSGKTLLVKTIAKMLDVPCYIQDCTKITESGYVGSDVEECIVGLLRASNYDIERTQCGIVMLDEGDKIAVKGAGPSITRDVSGEGVQQSLLKIVEGDLVGVPPMGGRKHPEQPLIYVDTSNILFILSGAFVGLDRIVEKRIGMNRIGFNTEERNNLVNEDNVNSFVTPQDIRDFGLIPELVGRFPIITYTNKLTEENLYSILKEPKNSIVKQFVELLKMDNTNLVFEDDALRYVAKMALELGNGARGLRNLLETVLADIMFDAPNNTGKSDVVEFRITEDMVREKIEARYKNVLALKRAM